MMTMQRRPQSAHVTRYRPRRPDVPAAGRELLYGVLVPTLAGGGALTLLVVDVLPMVAR